MQLVTPLAAPSLAHSLALVGQPATPVKEQLTESELQCEVINLAKQYGHLVHHVYDSRRATGPGFPDLVIAGKNHVLFAELKSAGGNRSPSQTSWAYRLIAAGQHYVLWRPKDLIAGSIEAVLADL